ncbi:MAG: response regulator, partial [Anaerolineales bacterium]|nr:response regulator [Anaerolineales bacterium]
LAAVVEDDLFLADIYSDTLKGVGFDVTLFHDGEIAMQEVKKLNSDLIVLDLNLPKYSGIEIYRDLRAHPKTAETWVLIVTANPAQAAELTQSEVDAQNLLILSKPISVDQLEQLAQRLVFRK